MIYIASPYSSPDPAVRQARVDELSAVVAEMFSQGLLVFSPILHCHAIALGHSLPGDFTFWKRWNFDMLRRAERLSVLKQEGWEDSLGVVGEIEIARQLLMQIDYSEPKIWLK